MPATELNDALLIAAGDGNVENIRYLISQGAALGAKNTLGDTALILASSEGHADCILALVSAGADIDQADINKRTALSWASSEGHASCVDALIAAGASVTKADVNGRTPLIEAAANGHTGCLAALIAAGADLGHMDRDGCTALDIALAKKRDDVVDILSSAMPWSCRCGESNAYLLKNCRKCGEQKDKPAELSLEPAEANDSGTGKSAVLPDALRGWNWAAFFLTGWWAMGYRRWAMAAFVSLVALFGYIAAIEASVVTGYNWCGTIVQFAFGLYLGYRCGKDGNKWAWEARKWDSYEQYRTYQRREALLGAVLYPVIILVVLRLPVR